MKALNLAKNLGSKVTVIRTKDFNHLMNVASHMLTEKEMEAIIHASLEFKDNQTLGVLGRFISKHLKNNK